MTVQPQHTDEAAPARARRRTLRPLWVIVSFAAVVGVIAALGGFADVPVEKLPVIALGEAHQGSDVEATIRGSYLTATQPGQTFEADEGMQYFVVEARLLNTSTGPDVLDRGLVRILLGDVVAPEDEPYGFIDADSGLGLDFLQPGITVNALYFWQVPTTVAAGDELFVGIFDRERIVDDPIFGDTRYSTEPVVRVITTVGATT